MRTRHLVLPGIVSFTAASALTAAAAGTCAGEAASDSPCAPRVISGMPGYYEVHMDATTATPDFQAACAVDMGHTVWFQIAPTVDSHITFSTCSPGTTYDTVVQGWIATGDCEFPMRIDSWCSDDSPAAACDNGCSFRGSIVTVQATAGTTYLFEVGSYDQNSAACELCLEVSVVIGPTPPANDDCFDATPIGDTVRAFDTTGATTDGPPLPPECEEGAGTSCVQDVWYLYTAPCTGAAMVDLCGSAYDTRIAVYEADACPGDLLVCNDDSCGLWSRAQFAVSAGSSYLIRVAGYSGAGPGTMSVGCVPNLYIDPVDFAQRVAAAGYVELAVEDFSEAVLPPPPGVVVMDDPLDQDTDNGVFAPGDIIGSLSFQSNVNGAGDTGPAPRGTGGLIAALPIPIPQPAVVGANVASDGFDISTLPIPIPRPAALALEIADIDGIGELQVSVYDTANTLLSRLTVTGATNGAFVGATPISIPGPGLVEIGRINVWAPAGTREGVYRVTTYGPPPALCAADITGPGGAGTPDGNVDALDFLLLIGQWGTPCVGSCEADITGPTPLVPDGNVDSLDFLLLIAQWGQPGNCP